MCKTAIYKLKILGGGDLNVINQWGEPEKGVDQIFKVQWAEAKGAGGITIFDLNLVGGKILEETMLTNGY